MKDEKEETSTRIHNRFARWRDLPTSSSSIQPNLILFLIKRISVNKLHHTTW
jgi:hypothetical protein